MFEGTVRMERWDRSSKATFPVVNWKKWGIGAAEK
jgi:hypothetical protein